MTTVQTPPGRAQVQVGGTSPKTVARTGLYALMGANVVAVTYFFAQSGFGTNALLLLGRVTGLYAALTMAFQFILIARLPWFDRRLGMDRLTTWHRWTGFTLLWTLIAHAVLITFGLAQQSELSPVDQFVDLATTVEGVLRAIVALVLIIVIGGASAKFARRRMAYETWHFIHFYAYVAVVLAFTHQVAVGSTFVASPAATAYWWGLWTFALGSVVLGRFALPLWRNLRHQLRVAAVVPEADNVVSIYITGKDLDKIPARAGQFFLWRFLTPDRWYKANPFSLSAAPDGRSLRLTAKALGEGSASLRGIRVGTRVFAEGPYGAFTSMHRTKPDAVLVAGGVGITPIRALLEEMRGHVVVLYRVSNPNDAVLMNEMRSLAHSRGAILHLLTGPSSAPTPRGPMLGAHSLAGMIPDIRDRDVFVCGPPAMTRAVMDSLRELEVPKRQVHAERFSMAG